MKKYTLIERLIHNIDEKTTSFLAPIRKRKINNTDFTIFSNNCWGGKCYEFFGLQKKSPTIGLYFFASDYMKFIYNLKYYTQFPIEMISAKDSKYYEILKEKNQLDIPVGRIDDIEIIFLHYKNRNIAKEKWQRRIKRINWDNIILKFSYMNNCTEELLKKFDSIKGVKKILFIGKNNNRYDDSYVIPTDENGEIINDTFYWRKYFNIYEFINKNPTSICDMKISQKYFDAQYSKVNNKSGGGYR